MNIRSPKNESVKFGLACLPVGVGFGLFFSLNAIGKGWEWLPLFSSLSAFIAGSLMWKLLMNNRPLTYKRCALTGFSSALLGNFLTFYIMIMTAYLCYLFFGNCRGSLGDVPMNPIQAVVGALAYSTVGLFIGTWTSLLIGALWGVIFCHFSKSS